MSNPLYIGLIDVDSHHSPNLPLMNDCTLHSRAFSHELGVQIICFLLRTNVWNPYQIMV